MTTTSPFDVMASLTETVEQLHAAGVDPWPGYDPRAVPVAIHDGAATVLFGHPAPPAEFQPVAGRPTVCSYPGLHPAVRANSVTQINDVLTATVMLASCDPSVSPIAAIVAHEAFHVYQYQHHPSWGADESQALTYPVTSEAVHHHLLLELEALEQALSASEPAPWTRLALDLRRRRYALLPPGAAAFERATERLEGLAHYVEMQFAAAVSPGLPRRPLRFGPEDVRRRSYAVGLALATLLDRFAADWQVRLTENDALFLDELLDGALPPDVPAAALSEEATAAALTQARREVEEVAARREARRNAFATRAGWRLEVVASPAAPLRPRGFDPMNLHPLTEREVLHTRWLRLGNDAGSIELFGEVLTEGAGAHPLFAGVARMTVAGLDGPPTAAQSADAVTVTAAGIEATFRNATVTQTGQIVTITLQ